MGATSQVWLLSTEAGPVQTEMCGRCKLHSNYPEMLKKEMKYPFVYSIDYVLKWYYC